MYCTLDYKNIDNTIESLTKSERLAKSKAISNNILNEISYLVRIRDLAVLSNNLPLCNFNADFIQAFDLAFNAFHLSFATTNEFKLKEFIEYTQTDKIFNAFKEAFIVTNSTLQNIDVEESEVSFIYNAAKKAKEYSENYKTSVILSEDSGIIIPDIAPFYPGVISARHGYQEENLSLLQDFLFKDEYDSIINNKNIVNNLVVLLLILRKYSDIHNKNNPDGRISWSNLEIPDYIPAVLATTASVAVNGKEVSNHTGTVNGFINMTVMKEMLYNKTESSDYNIQKIIKQCTGFGYNPIFHITPDSDSQEHMPLEETQNMFVHRRNAFNQVLLDFIYKAMSSQI